MGDTYVSEIMTSSVITVEEGEDLKTVYDLMATEAVRHLPVVNRSGELYGVISESDIIRYLSTGEALGQMKVRDVMARDPITITPTDEIEEAAMTMIENKSACLPVVEGGHLVGIITETDFVQYVLDLERGIDAHEKHNPMDKPYIVRYPR